MSSLYGLVGEKLGHSISPLIHKMIFQELQIDGCYHLFEIPRAQLSDAVNSLNVLGASGINVTIPYKVSIMTLLHSISKEASEIGAVNTVVFKKHQTIGYNTDYTGFKMLLSRHNIGVSGKPAVILGTGGAARSVLQVLIDMRASDITFVTRDINSIDAHFSKYRVIPYDQLSLLNNSNLIINCTPNGMSPNINSSPIGKDALASFETAVDLIYNPKQTLFLKHADAMGLKTANGLYMLVAQAVAAQALWQDHELPEEIINTIYQALIQLPE